MNNFEIGDWVYAHDWCYGQIVELNDKVAYVEFETAGGGGCFEFDISDLVKAPAPKSMVDIRDDLLVSAGFRAGCMFTKDLINLPGNLEGKERLTNLITDAVRTYVKLSDDIPFDFFIDEILFDEFREEKPNA